MKNVKLLVCCHKKDIAADFQPYFPIHVGKLNSNVDLSIQGDDTGDNISSKNSSYCEMTGVYWAWKNLKNVDVIGLCHYRRYFDFHKQTKYPFAATPILTSKFSDTDLSVPNNIIDKIVDGTIVCSKPVVYQYGLKLEYCVSQNSEDFRVLQKHFEEKENKNMLMAFYEVMNRDNKLRPFNMFIMTWHDFDNYCSWLFNVLSDVESQIDITHYSTQQKRVFGFMAERLLNVYIYAKQLKTIETPVLYFAESNLNYSPLIRFILDRIYNFSFKLARYPRSFFQHLCDQHYK